MQELIDQAHQKSIELLRQNSSPHGYLAAPLNLTKPSYASLFGRDTSICALATLDSTDPQLAQTAVISLDTLRQARSNLGQIPFRADPQTGYRDFWFPGNLDSTLWWLLASLRLVQLYPQLADTWKPDLDQSLAWLRYQDAAETGLLMQGLSADWADEMPSHGAVLYSNALWYQVLTAYNTIFPQAQPSWLNQNYLDLFRFHFQVAFWPYDNNKQLIDQVTNKALQRCITWAQTDLVDQPYFMQYLSRRAYGWRCDLFANTLTLLTDLPNPTQRQSTQTYLQQLQAADPWPGRTLHPVISPGDPDWRPSLLARHQNLPHQYHNGGLWPYIGAFWVINLSQQGQSSQALTALHQLAQAAQVNNWQFNEYFHGQTHAPLGIAHQSWNAAMYLAAHQAVFAGKSFFLSGLSGAINSANPVRSLASQA